MLFSALFLHETCCKNVVICSPLSSEASLRFRYISTCNGLHHPMQQFLQRILPAIDSSENLRDTAIIVAIRSVAFFLVDTHDLCTLISCGPRSEQTDDTDFLQGLALLTCISLKVFHLESGPEVFPVFIWQIAWLISVTSGGRSSSAKTLAWLSDSMMPHWTADSLLSRMSKCSLHLSRITSESEINLAPSELFSGADAALCGPYISHKASQKLLVSCLSAYCWRSTVFCTLQS